MASELVMSFTDEVEVELTAFDTSERSGNVRLTFDVHPSLVPNLQPIRLNTRWRIAKGVSDAL